MSQGSSRLVVAGEIGWLVVSTTLLTILVVREPGSWRIALLIMLVVNVAVVGYRVSRMLSPRAGGGQPPT
jgi:purine-cytosine permease-like protein